MYISVTSSHLTFQQSQQVNEFLKSFLPRMRKFPGVLAIYHYDRPEKSDNYTLVIWEDENALKAYRSSDLVQEAIAFEKIIGEAASREAYPLLFAA